MKHQINLNEKTILITGVAVFIGAALAERIFRDYTGCCVIGIDNLNDYYYGVLGSESDVIVAVVFPRTE